MVHAELQQANAGGSIRTRSFGDCKDERKERTKKIRRRNADRRNGRSPCRNGHGRASIREAHKRFLLRRPNATAQLQSALPGMGPVSGRYPQTDPSQYSEAPRRPVVVPVGRVPEAARERFQPNLTRAEAALRIAVLTAKLKLLDGPPHTL